MEQNRPEQPDETGHVTNESPFFGIIQDAYKVFKRPTPPDDGACNCCMDADIKRDFFNHGQHDMPLHYLYEWYFAAVDPDLSKDIWAYMLPRIMDALASGSDLRAPGYEVVLYRFPTGVKANWTQKEWDVIDRFQRLYLDLFWQNADCYLDDIICMFAKAGWGIDDLFAQVFAWPTERLIDHLWRDWCASPRIYPSIWITAFWDKDDRPMQYYTSETLQKRMLAFGIDEASDTDRAVKALILADTMKAH